jgi:YD repeat-containing protein
MQLKKKKTFEYVKTKSTSIKGLKIYRPQTVIDQRRMNGMFYDVFSERWMLDKTIDYLYFDNHYTTSTTTYQYNNTNWRIKTENIYDGLNNTRTKKMYYPNDNDAESYESMINNGILSSIIEQYEQLNNKLLRKTITEYKNWGNNLFAPEFIKVQTHQQSAPESRITYHQYDNYGNPLYISKDDSDKIVYLWGYNYQYPVAEIKGATYAEVKNLLGETYINNLAKSHDPDITDLDTRLRKGFQNQSILISTFTYKPLIGMLSAKAPHGVEIHYEYDDFGRLNKVVDNEGNIVEGYNYHYANQ